MDLNITGHGEFPILLSTLAFCLVILFLLTLIFWILCKRFPIIYLRNIPKYIPENDSISSMQEPKLPFLSIDKVETKKLTRKCASFVFKMLISSNRVVYEKLGFDSLVLITVVRLFLIITAVCAFFNLVSVVPVNYISNTTVPINITNFLNKISIDNVPNKSVILWVHLVLLYGFTFIIYFLIFKFWRSLIYWKQKYFIDYADKNRSIIVQNIPTNINNSEGIMEHLKKYVDVNTKNSKIYVFRNSYHLIQHLKKFDENLFKLAHTIEKLKERCSTESSVDVTLIKDDFELELCLKDYKAYIEELENFEDDVGNLQNVSFVLIAFADIVHAHNLSVSDVDININSQKCIIAPEPCGIQYRNFIHSSYTRLTLKTIVWICTFVFTIFWTIPFGLISNLASSLSNPIVASINTNDADLNLVLQTITKSLLPMIILMIFYLALPFIMKFLSVAEGHIARRIIDISVLTKFSIFHLINTYFVFLISGTLWTNIHDIITKPLTLSERLTHGIPRQANFFTLYIIFFTNIVNIYELLQVVDLIKYFIIKSKKSQIHLEAIFKPMQPNYPHIYSRLLYIFGIGITQSLISPFLTLMWGFYFVTAYFTYTFSEVFSNKRYYSYKGLFWISAVNWITVYMIIFQLLMIGMFMLKDVNKISIAAIPLIIITLIIHMIIRNTCYSKYTNMTLETIQIIQKATPEKLDSIVQNYNMSTNIPPVGSVSRFTIPKNIWYKRFVDFSFLKNIDPDINMSV